MMFSSSVKKKQSKPIKDDKEISSTESTADNDNYNLKISESSNYVKFLQLTLEGSQSDDEGSHGDLDGYIEDDLILSECDADVDASDLTEAGKVHAGSGLQGGSFCLKTESCCPIYIPLVMVQINELIFYP